MMARSIGGGRRARAGQDARETWMRTTLVVGTVLAVLGGSSGLSVAQQSDACKQCREQYQRCTKNYSGQTCKTELDICLKGCRKK